MQKSEIKKAKVNILNLNQNRLLSQTLKKLFGSGLIKNQKLPSLMRDSKAPGVVKFLQEEF